MQRALSPDDLFPSTTFSETLLVQPPATTYWTQTLTKCGVGNNCQELTFNYNFTPPGWYFDPYYNGAMGNVSWNVAATLAVQPGNQQWNFATCVLGDPTKFTQSQGGTNCSSTLPGPNGGSVGSNLLSFGTANAPLQRTFQLTWANEPVQLGVAVDNIGASLAQAYANALASTAAAAGTGALGNSLQAAGSLLGNSGQALSFGGSVVGAIASLIPLAIQLSMDPTPPPSPGDLCLGGMIAAPPAGSYSAADTISSFSAASAPPGFSANTLYARQINDATQLGAVGLTYPARLDYVPSDGSPAYFNNCRAATNVTIVVDRATDVNGNWEDGLAWQPRSADSAVVPQLNAVQQFRVNPTYNLIEQDTWNYSTSILNCPNSTSSCAPAGLPTVGFPSSGYFASVADPSASQRPQLNTASMPISALSPDANDIALFFTDDVGALYVAAWHYNPGAPSGAGWQMWMLARGLPADANLGVLRASRAPDLYNVFWVGPDSNVYSLVVSTASGPSAAPTGPTQIPGVSASPGAGIAALARMPSSGDVFVVGHDPGGAGASVFDLTGTPWSATGWTATEITGMAGVVAPSSGLTASAPTVNDLDVFFVNASGNLQRIYWLNQLNQVNARQWTTDQYAPFSPNTPIPVASGQYALSSVTRSPDNIDVLYACGGGNLCVASATSPSTFTVSMGAADVPPTQVSTAGMPQGPYSIVAQNAYSLDVVASTSGGLLANDNLPGFDFGWQRNTGEWNPDAALRPAVLWWDKTSGQLSSWLFDTQGNVVGMDNLNWNCSAGSGCASQWAPFDGQLNSILWWDAGTGQFSPWVFDANGNVSQSASAALPVTNLGSSGFQVIGRVTEGGQSGLLNYEPGPGALSYTVLSGPNAGEVETLNAGCWECQGLWQPVLTADMNNDGDTDVLWYNVSSGVVSEWLLNGPTVTTFQHLSMTCSGPSGCASQWTIIGAADVNGDGHTDVTWYNASTGQVMSWLLDGSGNVTGTQTLTWTCSAPSGCNPTWVPVAVVSFP